ncbi:carbamoyl-phosphate synthase large subunit [Sporomusaceae bacterium BoRhaA]|uniref:ATP-grasp domain-containing protein n=1 Tax=Pelorhabdus rhamnosifermentans TaxID=2772457 RepID=UPI001C06138F|nr:ATP-grasp domain-containing protein [Pelorhabdus rhamnosifermentans]MBU2699190.1 carbamoyl-phosphate synthase large subunit [Pelorhabdus rhamnosifermentans]
MFTILFTAIGRRVELIKAFQESLKRKGIDVKALGADANPLLASAGYFVNQVFPVSWVNEAGYIEALLEICHAQQVDMLVPLFEPEFSALDKHRQAFFNVGTFVLLSNQNALEICNDKFNTYKFFVESGVKTPKTLLASALSEDISFPMFVKPCSGMGSQGAKKVVCPMELESALRYDHNMIVQQFISGTEYTVDVLADFDGQVLAVVPRERLEVRSGEVSKGKTVDRPDIIEQAVAIVEKLGAMGPLTLQCMDTGSEIYWIEINPRFGGGVPLSIQAGVDYPYMLYQLAQGQKVQPCIGQYKKNFLMLRYDQAVYAEG